MPQTQNPPYSKPQYQNSNLSQESQSEFQVLEYLHILKKRAGIVILPIVLFVAGALFVNSTQRPYYSSTTEVVLEPKVSETTGQSSPTTANSFVQDPTILLTQIRMIRSPQLADSVVNKVSLLFQKKILLQAFGIKASSEAELSEKERKSLSGAIQKNVSASQLERGVRILAISLGGFDPLVIKQATDAVAQSYVEINYQTHLNSYKQSFAVITKSLSEIREKIKTGDIASKKVDSELQLIDALKIYGEKHPTVVALRQDIPEFSEQLKKGMKNLQTMDLGQRPDLLPLLVQAHTDLIHLTTIEADLRIAKSILEQEVSTNKELYNSIFKKLQEVELSGGKNVWMDASVLEPADTPSRPIRPNKKMNLMLGLIMGLFIGVGLAYFLEFLDSSLRNVDDVRNYLKIFPLGMVPFVDLDSGELKRQTRWKEQDGSQRFYWNTAENAIPLYVAEAYRIIRTNLSFGSIDRELKVLQVTSAVKGEGKTTTATNLGISLAQTGMKVLLVDADMRRPSLDCILGLEGIDGGFSSALTNAGSWKNFVLPTSITNLHCLASGVIPPNPAELLSSKRVKVLIDEFRESYDMVIFDSPPVISVADSPILATYVDATVLVARSGFIPRHFTLQAKHAIENVNGKIIGCILNSVQAHNQPYYHRYYGYNSYYGKEGESGALESSARLGNRTHFDTIKTLREPLQTFIAAIGMQALRFLKWEQPSKKNKFPDVPR